MKISGIIIAKNEEELIEKAIKSLGFCSEIIVIDNNSVDKTSEIAKKNKAFVYTFKSNSFSEIRNFGKERATGDYLLYLDSDEEISPELKVGIQEALKSQSLSAYSMKRKNFYFGEVEWPQVEKIVRLFKKDKLLGWKGEIHESPIVDGEIGEIDEFIIHHTHRNLKQMLNKTIEWSSVEAKIRLESNHPKMSWWRFPRVMIMSFFIYYIKQKGYKAGTAGLIESIYQAFSTFITYAKLWEMQKKVN